MLFKLTIASNVKDSLTIVDNLDKVLKDVSSWWKQNLKIFKDLARGQLEDWFL